VVGAQAHEKPAARSGNGIVIAVAILMSIALITFVTVIDTITVIVTIHRPYPQRAASVRARPKPPQSLQHRTCGVVVFSFPSLFCRFSVSSFCRFFVSEDDPTDVGRSNRADGRLLLVVAVWRWRTISGMGGYGRRMGRAVAVVMVWHCGLSVRRPPPGSVSCVY
jgi:hypothetical protein